jgi:hypothetical protein
MSAPLQALTHLLIKHHWCPEQSLRPTDSGGLLAGYVRVRRHEVAIMDGKIERHVGHHDRAQPRAASVYRGIITRNEIPGELHSLRPVTLPKVLIQGHLGRLHVLNVYLGPGA